MLGHLGMISQKLTMMKKGSVATWGRFFSQINHKWRSFHCNLWCSLVFQWVPRCSYQGYHVDMLDHVPIMVQCSPVEHNERRSSTKPGFPTYPTTTLAALLVIHTSETAFKSWTHSPPHIESPHATRELSDRTAANARSVPSICCTFCSWSLTSELSPPKSESPLVGPQVTTDPSARIAANAPSVASICLTFLSWSSTAELSLP